MHNMFTKKREFTGGNAPNLCTLYVHKVFCGELVPLHTVRFLTPHQYSNYTPSEIPKFCQS
jgi:hypothetical protein